jgi:hypothetical protein
MAQTHTLTLLPCISDSVSFVELRQSFPSQIHAISPFVDQLMSFITKPRNKEGSETDIEMALTEREKEVEARLRQLLQSNHDESQLLAVWNALMTNNDRKNLDLVAAAAKRLFPENLPLRRKLESYLVVLLRYDGQTGS